ncbi:hypothetical protein PIB30_010286, partial [Stylosanthes scabra]|nr:hypothetical protein [Stylosanthes scabra]
KQKRLVLVEPSVTSHSHTPLRLRRRPSLSDDISVHPSVRSKSLSLSLSYCSAGDLLSYLLLLGSATARDSDKVIFERLQKEFEAARASQTEDAANHFGADEGYCATSYVLYSASVESFMAC